MLPKVECTYAMLSAENLHWFSQLYQRVYQKKMSATAVRKKYDHSAMNKPYLGVYALHEGRVAGFVGVCYYEVAYQGQREWAASFTDSMIDPDYQGRGVYSPLIGKMEAVSLEHGIHFGLGIGNDHSVGVVTSKRGWEVVCSMTGFALQVKTPPLGKMLTKLGGERAYQKYARRILDPYIIPYRDGILHEPDDVPRVLHDEKCFRQHSSPAHFLLELHSVPVWIKLGSHLAVGYAGRTDAETLFRVMEDLKVLAGKLYLPQIICQFPNDSVQCQAMLRHYSGFPSWGVIAKNLQSSFPLEKFQLHYCDVDSF